MITILRLSHRRDRDKRVTTHVGLTARAFGANKIIISGERDENLIRSLINVSEEWGGNFEVEYQEKWMSVITNFKGIKVHLTMYGERIQDKISNIKKQKDEDILIIVGSEKVPPEVYNLVDYNIAVGNQPHSEIAALAIFLDKYLSSKGLGLKFEGAKKFIEPQERGKKIVETED